MNQKLRKYLEENNILTYTNVGKGQWVVRHNNNKLIELFEEIRILMPRYKLKPFEEYQNLEEFVEAFLEKTHLKKCGSYEHKYDENSEYTLFNHFLCKDISNTIPNTKYFKFTEMNFWENERWNTYILDTLKNREILLYLNSRFTKMNMPKFQYTYNFLGKQRLPIATSRFKLHHTLFEKPVVIENIKKRSINYLSDSYININLDLEIEDLEKMKDDKLIDMFYKSKYFSKLIELKTKTKYIAFHQKYSDKSFKKFLFETYKFKDIDKEYETFDWYHSDDDYMTYEKIEF